MDGQSDAGELQTCRELRGAHVARAIASRQATIDLLRHLVSISAPRTGAAKVLLVFAWMGTSACEWLEGGLRVELDEEPAGTRVEVATDLGGGARERLMPPFVIKAPIEEFWTALRREPRIVGSLEVHAQGDRHLVLCASAQARTTSAPPPSFRIAQESLYARAPAPPKVPSLADESEPEDDAIDGGWDD